MPAARLRTALGGPGDATKIAAANLIALLKKPIHTLINAAPPEWTQCASRQIGAVFCVGSRIVFLNLVCFCFRQ